MPLSLLLAALLTVFPVPAVRSASSGAAPRTLFIASYNSSFPSFFSQVDGLRAAIGAAGGSVDVECLDAKRFPDAADQERFRSILAAKLSRLPAYDGVLLGDDHALRFYLRERELFGGAFAVFFGVNDRALALSFRGAAGITGVVEDVSAAETVESMLALNPGLRRVVAVADDTPAGIADSARFLALSPLFPRLELAVLDLSVRTLADLRTELAVLDAGTDAALLLSAAGDATGARFGFYESLRAVVDASPAPVYHLWEHGMGHGLVGGKLVSQEAQARAAAGLFLRKFRGEDEAGLEIVEESPNRYLFDAGALSRYGLRRSGLPKGSILIGGGESLIARYGLFALGLLLQGSIIALLLLNIGKRRRSERLLEESLKEKELLLREIHHRVKNNLAVVSALLRLQEDGITDPAAIGALTESRGRIESMAVLHEELYQDGSFSCVPMGRYLRNIVAGVCDLFSARHGEVDVRVEAEDFPLCLDDLMAVGLIVNEALSNAFKYAFKDASASPGVLVDARREGDAVLLEIADNGTGFPEDRLSDPGASGLGLRLIRELSSQLRGSASFSNGGGARVSVRFVPSSRSRIRRGP